MNYREKRELFTALENAMAHGDQATGDHDMAGHAMHGQGGMAGMHMRMQAMMDTDKDGKVSASEHAAGARAMFSRVDADHGFLHRAGRCAGHAGTGNRRVRQAQVAGANGVFLGQGQGALEDVLQLAHVARE